MKLIIATPSPYARKVRVVLREKQIDFEEIVDVPWNKDTLTKNLNPLGKIPILLEEGKEPLFDSKIIVQYLDHVNQTPLMYPKDPLDNINARVVETMADGVCDAIVLVFLRIQEKKKHCAAMTGSKGKKQRFLKAPNIFQTALKLRHIL